MKERATKRAYELSGREIGIHPVGQIRVMAERTVAKVNTLNEHKGESQLFSKNLPRNRKRERWLRNKRIESTVAREIQE